MRNGTHFSPCVRRASTSGSYEEKWKTPSVLSISAHVTYDWRLLIPIRRQFSSASSVSSRGCTFPVYCHCWIIEKSFTLPSLSPQALACSCPTWSSSSDCPMGLPANTSLKDLSILSEKLSHDRWSLTHSAFRQADSAYSFLF